MTGDAVYVALTEASLAFVSATKAEEFLVRFGRPFLFLSRVHP